MEIRIDATPLLLRLPAHGYWHDAGAKFFEPAVKDLFRTGQIIPFPWLS